MRTIPVSVGDAKSLSVGDIVVDEGGRRHRVTGVCAEDGGWISLMRWNWRTRLKEWTLDRVRTLRLRRAQ
jgi:hypothetical protein